ncbi:hypothetical protein M378DRAFT_159253 [Amanita muscaria Koide BX008]|uniref:Uncharacterized protein n=1 Tax=Amanita muscaria (strain Koide BX008) TaxID=946122 RepID=A0A0C2TLM6_AMAMK|nr:hypothetical protein M378DRAFT_159253 [Amanita muscaria Koide BX008]
MPTEKTPMPIRLTFILLNRAINCRGQRTTRSLLQWIPETSKFLEELLRQEGRGTPMHGCPGCSMSSPSTVAQTV